MLAPSVSGGICRCCHHWCTPAGALILVSGTNRKKYITQVGLISVRFSSYSYITRGSTFLQVNLQTPKWVTGGFASQSLIMVFWHWRYLSYFQLTFLHSACVQWKTQPISFNPGRRSFIPDQRAHSKSTVTCWMRGSDGSRLRTASITLKIETKERKEIRLK